MSKGKLTWMALLLVLPACGEDDEAIVTMEGAEPGVETVELPAMAAPPPEHDGTVIVAEDYPVEVVTHESGQVYAYVLGDEVPAPERMGLTVEVPAGGSARPVEMVWNEPELRYEGRVRGAEISPGPVTVVVSVDGEPYRGYVDEFVIAPPVVVRVVAPPPPPPPPPRGPSIEIVVPDGHPGFRHRGRGRGPGFGRVGRGPGLRGRGRGGRGRGIGRGRGGGRGRGRGR